MIVPCLIQRCPYPIHSSYHPSNYLRPFNVQFRFPCRLFILNNRIFILKNTKSLAVSCSVSDSFRQVQYYANPFCSQLGIVKYRIIFFMVYMTFLFKTSAYVFFECFSKVRKEIFVPICKRSLTSNVPLSLL